MDDFFFDFCLMRAVWPAILAFSRFTIRRAGALGEVEDPTESLRRLVCGGTINEEVGLPGDPMTEDPIVSSVREMRAGARTGAGFN